MITAYWVDDKGLPNLQVVDQGQTGNGHLMGW